MREKDILNILKSIQKDILDIKTEIPQHIKKNKHFSHRLSGGLKDPEIRASIIKARRSGATFKDIAAYLQEQYPDHPGKQVSRSAIHRFFRSARNGRLREYGIEPFFTEQKE